MRILISGAGGFLGLRLSRWLQLKGHEVFGTTRSAKPYPAGAELIVLDDALNPQAYAHIVKSRGIDAVVNLVAAGVQPNDRDPQRLIAANSIFPAQFALASATAGATIFVHIGSSAEYAPIDRRAGITENEPLIADRLYGASKAAGTLLVQAATREVPMKALILRLFNIFGPGEKPYRLFPSLVDRLSRGEPVPLSSGTQMRDFLFVDDACSAIERILCLSAVEGSALSGVFNLASGNAETVRNFALSTARALNADPALLQFGSLPLRPDDLPYVVADTTRLSAVIGAAQTTSLADAINATLAQTYDVSENGHR